MRRTFLKILLFFALLFSLSNVAQALEKYNLVLFYADWNVYSPKAIETLSQVANNSKQITFEKINVDDEKAFVRMKQLGIMPTSSIPYYFLMDKKKKILYGSTYNNESAETITLILLKRI